LRFHKDSNFQNGSPFGSVWAHSFTFSHIPRNVNVIPRLHFLLSPFHVPCLGYEPKAKVMTLVL
jgi:hypothetical protein